MSVTNINGNQAFQLPNGTFWLASGAYTNCTVAHCPVALSVYGYRPSLAASGVLIALYFICMIIQIVLGFRYKTWWFMGSMVFGCIDEILGYAGRILYWQNPWAQPGFIMQIVCITIGPVFFAAAIYVMLTQIITYLSPSHSRFAPKLFIWIFIPFDILSLVLQAIGGAMSSSSNGKSSTAVNIALAGLSIQVITLFFFCVLIVDYAIRSRSVWTKAALPTRFKVFCGFLALATILILIRCSYRIFELSEGYSRNSKALRDEGLFIGLESVMVIVAAYCLVVAHPGPVFKSGRLPPSDSERTSVEK
ncbi:RTA1-domain-containing protein [Microthyrium microscopicum]|uniref:RTA1-domain-containing protein n=1 Tax=Microthyrium microscopicum TaxID=703497 RepID=A0A6A6UG54_9PEZI|nr:RTA1-domain-containing protein [Microthyrium microscopicum]